MTDTKWVFDEGVARTFEDMLTRSIPQIDVMRKAVLDLALYFYQADTTIFDLGTSRGDAIAPIIAARPDALVIGTEVSDPMLAVAAERFKETGVTIEKKDLRTGIPNRRPVSVVQSILTLQFVPINYRQDIIEEIYGALEPGGAFILVEKVLGNTATLNRLMVETYHDLKGENGYTQEEIDRKALMLEGVLVPVTADWNEAMLQQAGFATDCFWRWMNFAGWVGYKRG